MEVLKNWLRSEIETAGKNELSAKQNSNKDAMLSAKAHKVAYENVFRKIAEIENSKNNAG